MRIVIHGLNDCILILLLFSFHSLFSFEDVSYCDQMIRYIAYCTTLCSLYYLDLIDLAAGYSNWIDYGVY